MTSLFNDNENIACESCGKVIMREMSFNSIKLFTVTINGKHWTRAKEICKALEYKKTTKTGDVIRSNCSCENITNKYQLSGLVFETTPVLWPADSQKYDLYINEQGMYELAFTSQQKEAKEFRKYCFNTLFPQIRQKLVDIDLESSNRQHQLAIEDMGREQQQRIEQNYFFNFFIAIFISYKNLLHEIIKIY